MQFDRGYSPYFSSTKPETGSVELENPVHPAGRQKSPTSVNWAAGSAMLAKANKPLMIIAEDVGR